jgi:mono/diheme cytochrome c family protein
MTHRKWAIPAALTLTVLLVGGSSSAAPKGGGGAAQIKRGEYLVTIGGCNDCHTPWKMGPNGPENDRSRLLSGHPEDVAITAAPPPLDAPWMARGTGTFTGWAGPWGVSFAANLTPDPETGLGKWTAQNFAEAMRSGRHMGRGRPILPPMPWKGVGHMTDADLQAVFAYLRSIPPIQNRVPDPLPPAAGPGAPAAEAGAPAPAATGK